MQSILQFLEQNKQTQLDQLKQLLSVQSISAQTDHKPDMEKAANWLKIHLQQIG